VSPSALARSILGVQDLQQLEGLAGGAEFIGQGSDDLVFRAGEGVGGEERASVSRPGWVGQVAAGGGLGDDGVTHSACLRLSGW
jgi:hypothetical protein